MPLHASLLTVSNDYLILMENIMTHFTGTIIAGTHDTIAVLAACSEALHALNDTTPVRRLAEFSADFGQFHRELVNDALTAVEHGEDTDDARELLLDVMEALDYLAPDGFFFGAHPDDGSDFGFWPNELVG